MSFLDKAKQKASKLVESTKDKVDDIKDKRKAEDLFDDLGRITYRQRTGRGEAGDEAEVARIVAELQGLEAEDTPGIIEKPAAAAPAAPEGGDGPPLPPPPSAS